MPGGAKRNCSTEMEAHRARGCTSSKFHGRLLAVAICLIPALGERTDAADADLILHHGKIVTVDRDFSIREALAIKRRPGDPGRLQ